MFIRPPVHQIQPSGWKWKISENDRRSMEVCAEQPGRQNHKSLFISDLIVYNIAGK